VSFSTALSLADNLDVSDTWLELFDLTFSLDDNNLSKEELMVFVEEEHGTPAISTPAQSPIQQSPRIAARMHPTSGNRLRAKLCLDAAGQPMDYELLVSLRGNN
jgi:hypothetical protein